MFSDYLCIGIVFMLRVLSDFFPSSFFVCITVPLFFFKLTWLCSVSTTLDIKQKLLLWQFVTMNSFISHHKIKEITTLSQISKTKTLKAYVPILFDMIK